MQITNGTITRNIDVGRLPEYTAKGYEVVKAASKPTPKRETTKKAGAK